MTLDSFFEYLFVVFFKLAFKLCNILLVVISYVPVQILYLFEMIGRIRIAFGVWTSNHWSKNFKIYMEYFFFRDFLCIQNLV